MKAVMYHYVRPPRAGLPHFRYLDSRDFARQLDHFAANGGFVRRDDFVRALETGIPPEGGGAVLTFDDGFADHHHHVLPELARRGLWGIFFVPTGVYVRGKALDVHRIHHLLGVYGGVEMMAALDGLVDDSMLINERVREFRELTYARQDNDAATTAFKRTLNYFIAPELREGVLDALCQGRIDQGELVRELYMSPDELREMAAAGMVLGSHTVSHPVLSTLDDDAQGREIGESFAFLESVLGTLPLKTFCYPYGGFHTFTPATERLLEALGCHCAFNVEPRDVNAADLTSRRQALPRYDCNMFPHGAASMGEGRGEE